MKGLIALPSLLLLTACVNIPDVYLIDRHTVMEVEASGEWPELDKQFSSQALKKGPTSLASDPSSQRRDKAFRILNGEFSNPVDTQLSAQTADE